MFGQLVIGLMMFFYLWGTLPTGMLEYWLTVLLLLIGFRILLNDHFQKRRLARTDQNWRRLYAFISLLSGIAWGFLGQLPLAEQQFYLVVLVLGGVTTSAMMTSAVYLPASLVFVPAVSLPFIFTAFTRADGHYQAVGWFALAYFGFLLVFLRSTHRTLLESIELRYENEQLVDELTHKKDIAEKTSNRAEQENMAKSKFLAAASHDLRQPLHALGLFFDALKLSPTLTERESLFPSIDYSIKSLRELMDALLDISKLDANAIEYQLRPTAVGELLQNLVGEFEPRAAKKGLQLRARESHYIVETDPLWLERILRNLLTNAIRYTSRGRILLGCRKRQDKIVLQIWDTGMGIPADELENIFVEFQQLNNPQRDRNRGLGLGLAIVDRLCNLLGHTIEVNSIPGKGTVFGLSMAISHKPVIEPRHNVVQLTNKLQDKVVLVIDDEEQINRAMSMLLAKWGCQIITATSEEIAITKLDREKTRPDVIISDFRLAENKTGIDAIHRINAYLQDNIAALLITGDTSPDRISNIQESGYKVLHKPVKPAQLRIMLNSLC